MNNAAVKRKINFKRKKRGLWLHAPKRAKINLIFEENQTTPDTQSRQLTSEIVKAPIKRQNGSTWNTRRRLFPLLMKKTCKMKSCYLFPQLYDPQTTKINFAVPNINSINNFDLVETNIPREIYPGVIVQALEFMPRDKNYVLSVDGKKLAPGLPNTHGDQDLFGHDEGNSLHDLKNRLETEIQEVETKHYDKVIRKKNLEETLSNEVQEKWTMERNQRFTQSTQILTVYYPSMSFIEEGAFIIHNNEQPFIMVSPDGSIGRQDLGTTYESPTPILTCEFKCPFPNENTVPVYYDIPLRYIPQILGEMASTHTYHIIYLSWSAESSTVFRAKFDGDLWEMMMNAAIALYGQTIPKRPTRVSENAKEIRQRMVTYRKTCVGFLCEIPSIKCTSNGISQTTTETPYVFPLHVQRENEDTESNIEKVLTESVFNIKESYQICRRKASEVLVWLLSDSDRQRHPEMQNSVPIAYAMKGYSLSTNIIKH
ncbi:unnamed protein product [Mytilus edulis]|uniref:YqaJ viral recombinase domain-containing protein n=1 Tax=Mytilus edulis TaxID=6550 RepID=A0A8S3QM82_MYTED|nr:unnamed protein product [Mytilus edulis]